MNVRVVSNSRRPRRHYGLRAPGIPHGRTCRRRPYVPVHRASTDITSDWVRGLSICQERTQYHDRSQIHTNGMKLPFGTARPISTKDGKAKRVATRCWLPANAVATHTPGSDPILQTDPPHLGSLGVAGRDFFRWSLVLRAGAGIAEASNATKGIREQFSAIADALALLTRASSTPFAEHVLVLDGRAAR